MGTIRAFGDSEVPVYIVTGPEVLLEQAGLRQFSQAFSPRLSDAALGVFVIYGFAGIEVV